MCLWEGVHQGVNMVTCVEGSGKVFWVDGGEMRLLKSSEKTEGSHDAAHALLAGWAIMAGAQAMGPGAVQFSFANCQWCCSGEFTVFKEHLLRAQPGLHACDTGMMILLLAPLKLLC